MAGSEAEQIAAAMTGGPISAEVRGLAAGRIKLSWAVDLDLGDVMLIVRGLQALAEKEICEDHTTAVARLAAKLGVAAELAETTTTEMGAATDATGGTADEESRPGADR